MFAMFAVMSELVGRAAFRVRWVGAGAALLILMDDRMLSSEMVSGRSIPLQMFLFATILYVLLDKRNLKIRHSVALGALAGLAVMNRFDALLFPALMCIGLFFLTRRFSIVFVFGIGAAVIVLPWVYYSISTFGSLFVTDNTSVALAVDANAVVTDWWPVSQPTVFDDPGGWIKKVIGNFHRLYFAIQNIITGWMFATLLCLVILGGAFIFVTSLGRAIRFDNSVRCVLLGGGLTSHKVRVFALFVFTLSMILSTYIVTGYFDRRYFAPIFWLGSLISVGLLVERGRSVAQRRTMGLFCFWFFATVTFAEWGANGLLWPFGFKGNGSTEWEDFERPKIISTLDACLSRAPQDTRILVIGDYGLVARLGALAGRRAMAEPRNMKRGRLGDAGARAFIEQWGVNYVLVVRSDRAEFIRSTLPVLPVPDCELDLYRLAGS